MNQCLIECYSEVRNLNSAIQMREQVKLLTLPFGDKSPKADISRYFRTETMKYLRDKVAHDISVLETTRKTLLDFAPQELP